MLALKKIWILSQLWWHVPAIPIVSRLRQQGCEFQAILGYTARPHLKEQNQNQNKLNKNDPK
jgi:hypothetical protein